MNAWLEAIEPLVSVYLFALCAFNRSVGCYIVSDKLMDANKTRYSVQNIFYLALYMCLMFYSSIERKIKCQDNIYFFSVLYSGIPRNLQPFYLVSLSENSK